MYGHQNLLEYTNQIITSWKLFQLKKLQYYLNVVR